MGVWAGGRSMAAMADAAARIVAVDTPSPFSLHYAGRAAGPSAPFGFAMRKFTQEAEALPITFPEHVTALTQVRVPLRPCLGFASSRKRRRRYPSPSRSTFTALTQVRPCAT
jgi:hypothetical protein